MPDVGDLVEVILASVIIYPVYRFRKSLGKNTFFRCRNYAALLNKD